MISTIVGFRTCTFYTITRLSHNIVEAFFFSNKFSGCEGKRGGVEKKGAKCRGLDHSPSAKPYPDKSFSSGSQYTRICDVKTRDGTVYEKATERV